MADVKKRRDLSLKEKLNILERYDKLPEMSQRNAALKLNISQPILCRILKKRAEIENGVKNNENLHAKRHRSGKDAQVESALKLWFVNVREHDARVNDTLMRQKAEELACEMGKEHFVATEGWFYRWKKRENVVFKQQKADYKKGGRWTKATQEFTPSDIFNAGETGLYYRALPNYTEGCKALKDYVTILCCVNMLGDKEKLLVIGKSKNPRCFESVKNLPVDYYSSEDARMTSFIFNKWLVKWDKRLDRKIVLLIDRSPQHCVDCQLKNIKVVFLPANSTSPCEGLINITKAYYRKEINARVFESMEDTPNSSAVALLKNTNLLDAIHLINMSWNQISEVAIRNYFRHCGFSKDDIEPEEVNIQPCDMTAKEFEEWIAVDNEVNVEENTTGEGNQESEEDEDVRTFPTSREMRKALEVLRRGVQLRSSDFQLHYNYENFINNLLRQNQGQTL